MPQNIQNLANPVEIHSSPESDGEDEQSDEDDDRTILREEK